jgi:hypothetical protein
MSPEERDAKYLWDMLDSARAVQRRSGKLHQRRAGECRKAWCLIVEG